jgi:osmotically-inducible protein OsmY
MVLKQNIEDELDFEPSVNAAGIGVAVEKGVVTLTGHVRTYAEKVAVEKVLWRVKGVKGIAEEIEVRPAGSTNIHDDNIVRLIVEQLKWNTEVPEDIVKVKVQEGWVTLSGSVGWHYQKIAVASAIRGLHGVVGITNLITILPQASADDVKELIEKALERNAEVEADSIRITTKAGTIILEGRVNSVQERMAVRLAAWSAPGVRDVVDHLLY